MSKEELLEALKTLPRSERVFVVREILRTLEDTVSSQEERNEVWGAELNARIAAMQAGQSGVSFDALLEGLEQEGGRQAS